jgi:hypothetical protein
MNGMPNTVNGVFGSIGANFSRSAIPVNRISEGVCSQQGLYISYTYTETAAPQFVISAQADSGTREYPGSPLQRLQLIKGWYEDGEMREQVMDVAGGDNNASVDINSCEPSGNGHQQLCAVWSDPDFNPEAPAFYYTRLLENPSCRWSQRICADAGVRCEDPASVPEGMANCCAPEHQKVIQERAWSSPIWYTPAA